MTFNNTDNLSIDDLIDAFDPSAQPAPATRPTVELSISTTTGFLGSVTVQCRVGPAAP